MSPPQIPRSIFSYALSLVLTLSPSLSTVNFNHSPLPPPCSAVFPGATPPPPVPHSHLPKTIPAGTLKA
ncbi:hypothetical protein glysoja_007024 [Glycine soja]|nr:hypothetical protein glysoja_007024 [Glycine soja]